MKRNVGIHLFFVVLILSYFITLHLKVSNQLGAGLWRSYFNDFICIPVVLYLATLLLRLIYQKPKIQLTLSQIVVAVVMFSVTFEYIAPKYYAVHTSDFYDVVCYFIGGFIFWRLASKF